MKTSTLFTVFAVLNNETVDPAELKAALEDVTGAVDKIKGERAATMGRYDRGWERVAEVLSVADAPMTVDDIRNTDPATFPLTSGEIRYGLNHYWKDRVVRHENGRNPVTYSLA